MTRDALRTPAVASFAAQAREYCSFVEEASSLVLWERLMRARERLVAIYAAGIELPFVEPTSSKADDSANPDLPMDWSAFEEHEMYWTIFDPYDMEQSKEPGMGSLSDDVLDVYLDVRRGLVLWDSGALTDAIWEWRFSLDSHWGHHAVDALQALHRACKPR